MSPPFPISRRGLIKRALTGAAALIGAGARARGASPEDRGIGGTGAAPAERPGEDRGIGGTGVVGTIRRFGSIVVNDLRIGYPRGVAVTIDGEAATAADLRLGQVVAVLAVRKRGRLATRRIAVTHEVVGPVEVLGPHRLKILGQIVEIASADATSSWREGDIVAVSGLRRPDGTIEASLLEPGDSAALRVTGLVEAGPDGMSQIGGLPLEGHLQPFLGRHVTLKGQLVDGQFEIRDLVASASAIASFRAARLSIESYVLRRGGRLHLAAGLDIAGGERIRGISQDQATLAVVTASVEPGGGLRLDGVRMERGPRGRGGRRGRGASETGPGRKGEHGGSRGEGAEATGQESGPSTGRSGPRSGPGASGQGPGGSDGGDAPGGGSSGRGRGRR